MKHPSWLIGFAVLCACQGCVERYPKGQGVVDECPDDPAKMKPGACGCGVVDVYDIASGDYTCHLITEIDLCPTDPNKRSPGICGCGTLDVDSNENGILDCIEENVDLCPDDPDKKLPGICGCGIPDDDDNHDGIPNCLDPKIDLCPADENKTMPGECGCGVKDIIYENGTSVCANIDLCPDDRAKNNPGVCGCGVADLDKDDNGTPDCLEDGADYCPKNKEKRLPGVCGCNVSDLEIDEQTGLPKCLSSIIDLCPDDPNKTRPGVCGCGKQDDSDTDKDGIPDCLDGCPNDNKKSEPGRCGCGVEDSVDNLADNDMDKTVNCLDVCPDTKWKSVADACSSCDALEITYDNAPICAQLITNAGDLVALRDKWNAGEYRDKSQTRAFMLVDDINLGDKLKNQQNADKWVGIGNENYPFDAIFLGNNHTIEASVTVGKNTERLTLGNNRASYVALFGFTSSARIEKLNLEYSVTGKDFVAALVASAETTQISSVTFNHGTIEAGGYGAGIAAAFYAGGMTNVSALEDAVVKVSGDYSGGIAAQVTDSQMINHAVFLGTLNGANYTGGIAATLASSTLSNAAVMGSIVGDASTGGIVGELSQRSILFNAYSTSRLVCHVGPCALIAAVINDFSSIKNAYTVGRIVDETQSKPTDNPSPSPEDPADPDDPEIPPDNKVFEIPVAALVASVASTNNVIDKLYYWREIPQPPLPADAVEFDYVELPEPFNFPQLIPVIVDPETNKSKTRLLDALSNNLSCYNNSNVCSLDSVPCYAWTPSPFTIYLPDNAKPISVSLPVFRLE